MRRAPVIVLLVVLLGGLGIGGAAALWSQSSDVEVQVATGTWVEEPAKVELQWGSATLRNENGSDHNIRLTLSWKPIAAAQKPVSYRLSLAEESNRYLDVKGGTGTIPASSDGAAATTLHFHRDGTEELRLKLTIVPDVAGADSAATVWTIVLNADGTATMQR